MNAAAVGGTIILYLLLLGAVLTIDAALEAVVQLWTERSDDV